MAIPLGVLLGWTFNLKLYGLWIGIGTGMFLIGVTEAYLVLSPNWEKILERAEMLKEADDEESDEEFEYSDSDSEPSETTGLLPVR